MACSAVSVALMILGVVSLHNVEGQRDNFHRQLETAVEEVMKCANINSLGVALISTERDFNYTANFETSSNNPRKLDGNRIFCVGGATRAFTAVLLAKLLTEHPNITWNTPIRNILKNGIHLPYQYLENNLNLKDIFAMRSGLAGMDIVPVAKPYSADELVRNLRYAPPVAGFREKSIYNEVLFSLLEKIVDVLGGDSWQNLIKQHIFMPLQMTSTTFLGPASYRSQNFVKGTVQYGAGVPQSLEADSYSGLELVSPAVSVCTTAEDMVKWFRFLLNDGKVDNRVIVEQAALKATYSAIQLREEDADPVGPRYGHSNLQLHYSRNSHAIGWISGFYRENPFVSQDGSIPGYQTLATIIPSKKLAVFVAFNGDRDAKRFAAKVLINIMGIDFITTSQSLINRGNICSIISSVADNAKQRKQGTSEQFYRTSAAIPRPLDEYVGKYRNYAYGDIHVKASVDANGSRDGGLNVEYGLAEYKLFTTNKNNTFQLIVQKGGLWYTTNADWYRSNQEMFAEFFSDSPEPDQKFTSVKIHGFDRHYTPEFSTNAQKPHYEQYTDDYRCSAPVLTAWQWTLFLIITVTRFS